MPQHVSLVARSSPRPRQPAHDRKIGHTTAQAVIWGRPSHCQCKFTWPDELGEDLWLLDTAVDAPGVRSPVDASELLERCDGLVLNDAYGFGPPLRDS